MHVIGIVADAMVRMALVGDAEAMLRLLLALALLAAVVPVLLGLAHPLVGALARLGVAVGGVALAVAVAQRVAAVVAAQVQAVLEQVPGVGW